MQNIQQTTNTEGLILNPGQDIGDLKLAVQIALAHKKFKDFEVAYQRSKKGRQTVKALKRMANRLAGASHVGAR